MTHSESQYSYSQYSVVLSQYSLSTALNIVKPQSNSNFE